MRLDRERPQESSWCPGDRVARTLACTGVQFPYEMCAAGLMAMVAVTMGGEEHRTEFDWEHLVDGRPQTGPGRGRRPVLYVEHELLRRYFLVRVAVRVVAVDAILVPVQRDSEQRPTLYIIFSVEDTRGSLSKIDTPYY